MAKKKPVVTNAMRMLSAAGIAYEAIEYDGSGLLDGEDFGGHVARLTGIEEGRSFKTLTARGDKTGVIVACIPVNAECDLKKLARVSGNKKAELLHVKELLSVTGYERGSVSPIGMKKKYPTYIDETCKNYDKVAVSAGVCGCTLVIDTDALLGITGASAADIKTYGKEEKNDI